MAEIYRFPIMMAVSVIVLFLIILLVTRAKTPLPSSTAIMLISILVSVGGMIIAKYGANFGLPWTVYYSVPAILTIFSADDLFPDVIAAGRDLYPAGVFERACNSLWISFLGWGGMNICRS